MKSISTLKPSGNTYVFSFPYYVLVDTTELLKVKEINFGNTMVRIYPFFRSAKANFIPTPSISPHNIPFLEGAQKNISSNFVIDTMAVLPIYKDGQFLRNEVISSEEFRPSMEIIPMDSFRIDVFEQNEEKAHNIAEECFRELIQLVRYATRQWWVEHISNSGLLKCSFPILKNGYALEQPTIYGSSAVTINKNNPTCVDEIIWENVIDCLEKGLTVPLYKLLILDARHFSATKNYRRAILDAVISCEQARDIHFERIYKLKSIGSKFRLGKVLTGNNLPTHLSEDLVKLTNGKYSYEKDFPKEFELIKNLWNVRGNIAHGRPMQYFKDSILFPIDNYLLQT